MPAARSATPALRAALAAGVLAWVVGCADDYEPNYLFRGEWIDIDGQGRSAEETCGGTFAYIDTYAGALAREFGVEGHLGDYRWYSQERFYAELPCQSDDIAGCVSDDHTLFTPYIPLDHELVHLAEIAAAGHFCPKPLSEGLATYYGTVSKDAQTSDFELLSEIFANPSAELPGGSYAILGRFAAYLIARFGHDPVLEVCLATGRYPDAEQLSNAMGAILGQTTAELLADFEPELGPECNRSKDYQSRVFACGVAEAAPNIGLVGDEGVELRYEIDCANERTIGPFGDRIWIVERLDLDLDANWLVWVEGEEVEGEASDTSEVELILAGCEPCGEVPVLPGDFFGIVPLDAGRYWFELNAPAGFVGTVVVKISR